MARSRLNIGNVYQIELPDGRFAYCRLYNDATIGIYRQTSSEPSSPPIGSREFLFQIGVSESVLRSGEFPRVGFDGFKGKESDWPDPTYIPDPLSGGYSIYFRGKIKKATKAECENMEPTIVCGKDAIVKRIVDSLLAAEKRE